MSSAQSAVVNAPWTGGCQCGAIRFRAAALGRPSFCHCRMCQKAFGATGGALVTAKGLTWARGAPKYFWSSKAIKRGFCADCGTPLTFDYPIAGGARATDLAIAAFDRAGEIAPVIQLSPEEALPWTASVTSLPGYPDAEHQSRQAWLAGIQSNQHPDHDTNDWPVKVSPASAVARGCLRAMPVLGVKDMARALTFYQDKLGFAASTWGEPATFAILQRGMVTLALASEATPAVSRNWAAYIYVADADALYRELQTHGVALDEPPQTQPWNCREFVVDDPDGHMIAFGQVLNPDPLGPGLSTTLGRDAPR
jgi:uncharacterized glyoxalase superfamily protein PhnB